MWVCASRPNDYHKTTAAGTSHNGYEVDGIKGDAENEVPEPEDAHEEGKLCLIYQDSICQDTSHEATFPGQAQKQTKVTCTSNRSQASVRVKEDPSGQGSNVLVSVFTPYHKTSRQPPTRSCSWVSSSMSTSDEGTFHYVTFTAPSSVIEYVAPAPAVTHVALSPAIEYVAPTPVVTHT